MHQPPTLLPNGLETLFDVKYLEYSYQQLLAESIALNMSIEEIKAIELATRDQAQNNIWFKYRAGRITASKFKAVCRANLERPSLSLLKGICYPQKVIFYSKQTSYVTKHERIALKE